MGLLRKKSKEEPTGPTPKEALLFALGSEEFEEFYREFIAGEQESDSGPDLLDSYLEKIKTPECYVGVLGVQGSGKTSLLNSLAFNDEVLPVEVEETTCIPTLLRRIYPGEMPGAEVHYQDGRVENIPLKRDFLDKIVDNRHNPGNLIKAAHVVCRVDSELLQEGFVFVDLPGVGSLTDANEQATMNFLRETHIGIFLLRTVPPITDSEAGFIRVAWPMVQQSLFVQNLWAQETEAEVKSGMEHNEEVLKAIAEEKQTKVPKSIIPVDIALACRGIYSKKADMVEESGLEVLKSKIRDYANLSFLKLFYRQTGQFFVRLIQRAQNRIEGRLRILQEDKEEVIARFGEEREKYLQNKEELEEKVTRHMENFLENISQIKTDWLPERLEQASKDIYEKMEKTPLRDIKEEDFRQLVRQACSDHFNFVYTDLRRELASTAEKYVDDLTSTLYEMASLEQIFDKEQYAEGKKDPKAAKGWSVALTGSIAPIVSYAGMLAGPAGWGIFGGALLAGGVVRWISGATAHKRIMRGVRKAVGDARRQIRQDIIDEIDGFAKNVTNTIRETVKSELQAYEQELQRIDKDLQQEISDREGTKENLEINLKQANVFLKALEYVK